MGSKKGNLPALLVMSRQEEEKLLMVWKLLKDFENSDYPAVQSGCERARNEIWQVIFELDLKVNEEE